MMIDYLCPECGLHFERFFRQPPEQLECDCGATATRTYDPNLTLRRPLRLDAQPFDPVVIHRDANGNIRFPGSTSAPVPEGFERVELRTTREVRSLEREVNLRENAAREQHLEREANAHANMRRDLRSELRQAMHGMSAYGRDFARHAMETTEQRQREKQRHTDAGFYVEAFSQDSSNREAQVDASTGWQRRKR
jgi:hypothetical protein